MGGREPSTIPADTMVFGPRGSFEQPSCLPSGRLGATVAFPDAQIDFKPDLKRQGIIDSWPAGLNDHAARRDWDWEPAYDVERAFHEYLIPNIKQRYQK